MILAAGYGTRLKPLTDRIPKALLEINDKPLIRIVIEKLKRSGIGEIVVNVHHHREQVIRYFSENDFGIKIHLSVEENILGTGGGIKKAVKYLSGVDSFLVYNADVISDIDLTKLFDYHSAKKSLATLAIQKRDTTRALIFNSGHLLTGRIAGGKEIKYTETPQETYLAGFCGVHIISQNIFDSFEEDDCFDIFTTYFRLVKSGKIISGYDIGDTKWIDAGTLDNFTKLNAN